MRAPTSRGEKPGLYSGFAGMNTERGSVALENPQAQAFTLLDGLICTPDGVLVTEPHRRLIDRSELGSIVYIAPTRAGGAVYCLTTPQQRTPTSGIDYTTPPAGQVRMRFEWTPFASRPSIYVLGGTPASGDGNGMATPTGTSIVSQAFLPIPDRRALLGARALLPVTANPNITNWSIATSGLTSASAAASVQGRIVLLGEPGSTRLLVSRVAQPSTWPNDETPGDPSVIKAFFLDIGPVMPEGAVALAAFEADKLAIFSRTRGVVYKCSPDLTKWELLPGVESPVGVIGSRAVQPVGDEVFFCSDRGIHSLRRSDENGVTVFTRPLSEPVAGRYAELLDDLHAGNLGLVNMAYDPRSGTLHTFFPLDGASVRLSLRLAPDRTQADTPGTWYESNSDSVFCAAWDGTRMLLGCDDGSLYEESPKDKNLEPPPGRAVTPILWLGSMNEVKQATQLMLIADGHGDVVISAEDDIGRDLGSVVFSFSGEDGAAPEELPGERRHTRPFERRFTGVRFTIEVQPKSRVRIYGFGVVTKEA